MTPEASDRDVEIVREALREASYANSEDGYAALARLTERLAELERERDRLQHFIECADTPLMRDVLQRVRELEEALRMLWDNYLLTITYEQKEQIRAALREGAPVTNLDKGPE